MPTTTINNPEVLWAQRSNKDVPEKNVIYLTIAVEDTISPTLELTADELHYHSKNKDGKEFDLKLPFYEKIDPENSKITHNDRHTYAVIRKATPAEEYWPRLTKEKVKYFFIKTDFDKWADEDEQEEAAEPSNDAFDLSGMGGAGGPGGNFDLSALGGMGGMGGLGGLEGLGGLGGLGGGDSTSELLESLKNDAAMSGKSLDDFAKQYGAGKDDEKDEDEEVNTVKNDVLS